MKPEDKETEKQSVRQANWKVRAETLRRINQQCLDRDLTQADLAQLALDALDAQAHAEQQSGPHLIASHRGDPRKRRMFELLELIIESGTAHRIAIENNLEMLAFALVATRGRQPEEIRGLLDSMLNAQRLEQEEAASKEPNGGTNHKYGT